MSNSVNHGRDDQHPIPAVDVCDIEAERTGGGVDLVIIIANPMRDDLRSRERLMKKVENYLGYIRSDAFARRYGAPTPTTTGIIVRYHRDTDPGVLTLLAQCRGWVEDNGAALVLHPC